MKTHYDTLSVAYNKLRERGFTTNFEAIPNKLLIAENGDESYTPDQIKAVEFHRFEGSINPADASIIYALEANGTDRGILLDAYGADSSSEVAEFMKDVTINKN